MPETNHTRYKAEVWDIMQFIFGKFNDHQIHCVIQFDSHIYKDRLEQAIDLLIDAFPLIKCKFVENSFRPYWEDSDFTAKDILSIKTTEKVVEEIQKTICTKTSEFKGPQLKIHIIRSKSSDSLCIIINHMLLDGADFKELLYLLSSIYSGLSHNSNYKPTYKMGTRSADQVINSFNLKSKAKILSQNYSLSRHDDSIVFGLEGDKMTPFIVTHAIGQEKLQMIKSYAKQYGATVNDAILAAYIRGLHKTLSDKTTAIQCVLDLRKYLPNKKSNGLCNLTSNLVCDIGADIGDNFRDTLIKVKQTMDIEKSKVSSLHLIMLLEGLFRTMPYKISKFMVSKGYRNPPFAMSNIGIIDHTRLTFDNVQIKSTFMTGSIKYNPLFQLALSTFKNEITLSVAFHGTPADKDKINKFLKLVEEELMDKIPHTATNNYY